jgi:hypothetical protein
MENNLELSNTETLDESISNAIGSGRGGYFAPRGGQRASAFSGESYSSADASYFKSNKNRTKAFQKYANSKGYTPRLAEDGIWGAKTQAAWDKLGDDFVKSTQDLINQVTTTTTSSEVTDAAKKEYEKSGSKLSFKDWINSQAGRDSINLATQIANLFAQGKQYKENESSSGTTFTTKDEEKPPLKILGMSPVTFGIVTASVIVVASIVTYKLIKK